MGTHCGPKPENVKQYLMDDYTYEHEKDGHFIRSRALDCKIVKLRTAYLAVERITPDTREVYAAVVLLSYPGGRFPFCEKHIDEFMGPFEAECPKSILQRLTPNDNERSKEWRGRCWENIDNPNQPFSVYAEFGEVKKYQNLNAAVKYSRKLAKLVGDKVFLRIKREGNEDSIYGISFFGGDLWHISGPRVLRNCGEVI